MTRLAGSATCRRGKAPSHESDPASPRPGRGVHPPGPPDSLLPVSGKLAIGAVNAESRPAIVSAAYPVTLAASGRMFRPVLTRLPV
jgi:hypothetical protein